MDEGTSSSSSPVASTAEADDARKDVIEALREALAATDLEFDGDGQPVLYAKSSYSPDRRDDGGETRLSLSRGDCVRVLNTSMGKQWWWVEAHGRCGYVPADYLGTEAQMRGAEDMFWQNQEYFGQYATLKVHQEMLADAPRTLAYQRAIKQCRADIEGKVVLDVGCGTGILGMMCVRDGGAARVYAVDASPITEQAQRLVEANGLADRITVIQGKVEDAEIPEKVDLILSEWMGTFLLFEFMLESIVSARDLFLKPDGVVWPSDVSLYLAPCSAPNQAQRVDFWDSLYGFDFTPMRSEARQEYHRVPIFNHQLAEADCLAPEQEILRFAVKSMSREDLELNRSAFEFTVTRDGTLHGFASWFDVAFARPGSASANADTAADETVRLSTGPAWPRTHWNQDLCMLDDYVAVWAGDVVRGSVTLERNADWRRHMLITVDYVVQRGGEVVARDSKQFGLWRC